MNCATCEQLADSSTLYCNGSCSQAFHISCLAKNNGEYKKSVATYVNKIPNLKWICDNCGFYTYTANDLATRLSDIVLLADSAKELAARLTSIVSFAENALTMLTPSKSTSQTVPDGNENAAKMNNSSSSAMSFETTDDTTPKIPPVTGLPATQSPLPLPELPAGNSNVTKRHVRPRSLSVSGIPNAKHPKNDGVNSDKSDLVDHIANHKEKTIADLVPKSNILEIADIVSKTGVKKSPVQSITVKTNMERSIYIKPFEPWTKASDIIAILEKEDDLKHIVPNVKCKKLTARGKSVRFASFKLDVRRDQFDIVMAAQVWKRTGNDDFIISEFVPKPNVPNVSVQNPFSDTPPARNHPSRPSMSQSSANRPPHCQPLPQFSAQHRASQSQNFCNNACCNPPRTRRNHRPKNYGGNRHGYQPYHGN